MATVKFLEHTDMNAIPTSAGTGSGISFVSSVSEELSVNTGDTTGTWFLYGTFTGSNSSGTIAAALIDTPDILGGPNLLVTDLAFATANPFNDIFFGPDGPAGFLANMLSGDDTFLGSDGSDVIDGFNGNDTIFGGAGADIMNGGAGNDSYFVDNIGDVVNERRNPVGPNADRVFASASWNMTPGSDIERLSTADNAGTQSINLRGNELDNFVVGNDGQNIVSGGLGNDNLVGLGGNDFFLFENAPNNANADYVADFTVGQDHIMLLRAGGYGSLAAGTLPDANFLVRGTAFQDANDFIIWDAANGVLSYDADGSGAGAAQPIALLTPNLNLHASDIIAV